MEQLKTHFYYIVPSVLSTLKVQIIPSSDRAADFLSYATYSLEAQTIASVVALRGNFVRRTSGVIRELNRDCKIQKVNCRKSTH